MNTPWLSDEEITNLCAGILPEQRKRRCDFLKALGLAVKQKPNGDPIVLRSNLEAVLGGVPATGQNRVPADGQPDRAALMARFAKGKKVSA